MTPEFDGELRENRDYVTWSGVVLYSRWYKFGTYGAPADDPDRDGMLMDNVTKRRFEEAVYYLDGTPKKFWTGYEWLDATPAERVIRGIALEFPTVHRSLPTKEEMIECLANVGQVFVDAFGAQGCGHPFMRFLSRADVPIALRYAIYHSCRTKLSRRSIRKFDAELGACATHFTKRLKQARFQATIAERNTPNPRMAAINAAVRKHQEEMLQGALGSAVKVLIDLQHDAKTSAAAKIQASNAIMNGLGGSAIAKTPEEMTPQEIAEAIDEMKRLAAGKPATPSDADDGLFA